VNEIIVDMISCSIQISDGNDKGVSETEGQREPRQIESQDDQQTDLRDLRVYERRHKQQYHEQLASSRSLVTATMDVLLNSSLDPSLTSSSQAIINIPNIHILPRRTTKVNAGRPPSSLGWKLISQILYQMHQFYLQISHFLYHCIQCLYLTVGR
jgi:hypothetical protein